MATSAPIRSWIRIEFSGVNSTGLPSMWERKNAPASLTFTCLARLNTWKPPESVSVGPSQPMNRASPPPCATISSPGRRWRW